VRTSATRTSATRTSATRTTAAAPTITTAAAAELPHDPFVANLDDICKRGGAKAASYEDQYVRAVEAGDFTKAAAMLEQANRARAPLVAELAKLTPPTADQAAFARYKTTISRLVGFDERAPAAVKAHDLQQIKRTVELGEAERRRRTEAANDLGAKECSK
jgi:hypothetical protein